MITPEWYQALADAEADLRAASALLHPDRAAAPPGPGPAPTDLAGLADLRRYITSLRARLDELREELERAIPAHRRNLSRDQPAVVAGTGEPVALFIDRRL